MLWDLIREWGNHSCSGPVTAHLCRGCGFRTWPGGTEAGAGVPSVIRTGNQSVRALPPSSLPGSTFEGRTNSRLTVNLRLPPMFQRSTYMDLVAAAEPFMQGNPDEKTSLIALPEVLSAVSFALDL